MAGLDPTGSWWSRGAREVAAFSGWDERVTRAYIGLADTDELSGLTSAGAGQLLRNLAGAAGPDQDARTVTRLLRCLGPDRVRELVGEDGVSVRDLGSAVGGAEWDGLTRWLRSIGVWH